LVKVEASESRREREKRELRAAILRTAREIASEEGWEAVTIRRISAAIEYGPPAIYALFENKEAILNEVVRDGFRELLEHLLEAETSEVEAEAKLRALANAYWQFANDCPRLYKAMNGLDGVPFGEGYKVEAVHHIRSLISGILKEALHDKDLSPEELDDMVQIIRATFQGLISIAMAGRLAGGKERAEKLLLKATQDLLTAWRADPGGMVNRGS
jgi:AcrR family transcriptional regulator